MARREEIADRFSEGILKRLQGRKLIEVRDEARARAALRRIILENLQAEEQIDAEARKILQGHAREIRDTPADYSRLLTLVKQRLARERGFVL